MTVFVHALADAGGGAIGLALVFALVFALAEWVNHRAKKARRR